MAYSVITFDVRTIADLANRLGRLDPTEFGQAGVRAVNEVVQAIEPKVRENISATVNLSDAYLQARLGVRLAANPAAPEAAIYAPFRQTPLGRYSPRQLTQPANKPQRAKGDKLRGIPAGRKQAGVSVEVIRGDRKTIQQGFLMPLRNGNGMGVFTRDRGALRYQHRLGPAVYQLLRVQADRLYDDTQAALQLAVLTEAKAIVEKALA